MRFALPVGADSTRGFGSTCQLYQRLTAAAEGRSDRGTGGWLNAIGTRDFFGVLNDAERRVR